MSEVPVNEVRWFREPGPERDGVLNATFGLLDSPVVAGRADELAVRDLGLSRARLLEEVATLGGVLRGFGVAPGEAVVLDLAGGGTDAVTGLLAVARVGAVAVVVPRDIDETGLRDLVSGSAAVLALTDDVRRWRAAVEHVEHRPRGAIVRTADPASLVDGLELDWDVARRAGRTDPAGAAEVPGGAPAALAWPAGALRLLTTAELAVRLQPLAAAPVDAAALVDAFAT